MDHRPFESWLLEDKALGSDERRRLNAHLQACPACTALAEVDLALKANRMSAPARGFVGRFQVRLEVRKKALRRRNAWGFLILVLSVLGMIGWLSWPWLAPALQSPVELLGSWLSSLVTLWATFRAMLEAGSVVSEVLPGFVPTLVVPALLVAVTGWSLLWVFSMMKITKLSQGVQS
jgi:anti-sigma factor RsiW